MKQGNFWVGLILSLLTVQAQAKVSVCAVPQLYSALEALHSQTQVEYEVKYAVSQDLYAGLVNRQFSCDVIFSDEEKLPILLSRAKFTDPYSLKVWMRAPLVLWSKDPGVVPSSYAEVSQAQFKSLAIADASLTPTGFAAQQIFAHKLPELKARLKYHLYKVEHEYLVYSLVKEGLVQCGFISKPLALCEQGRSPFGSYWEVPRELGQDLLYYVILSGAASRTDEITSFYNFILNNKEVDRVLSQAGFANLTD